MRRQFSHAVSSNLSNVVSSFSFFVSDSNGLQPNSDGLQPNSKRYYTFGPFPCVLVSNSNGLN